MALSYKSRRRWSMIILLIGLPLYILFAIAGVALLFDWLGRPPVMVEFFIYVALGIVWALPLKFVFIGIGQADPNAPQQD